MALEAFSDEMLGTIMGGQNPWWRRGGEAAPQISRNLRVVGPFRKFQV